MRRNATVAKSLSEWMTVSVSILGNGQHDGYIITYRATHSVMRRLKSGQSRVNVSYSPPSPQMCEPYKVFYNGQSDHQ
jgi:hypothetical protein